VRARPSFTSRALHANPPGTANVEAWPPPIPWAGRGNALGHTRHPWPAQGGGLLSSERAMMAKPVQDTSIFERPTLPEAISHDTMVDPPHSFVMRAGAWLASMARNVAMAMRRPRLTDHLPLVSVRCTGEITHDSDAIARAERMLLDIMRSPPEYVDAAILIARATRALHKRGNDVFAEGFVVFALSRMPPDADGTIPIKRLREHVHDIPAARGILPVLLRLEEQGVVSLEGSCDQGASSCVHDMDRMRVRLLVLP
jgi:hypothetical protein